MRYLSRAGLLGLAAATVMALPVTGQAAEFALTASSSHPPIVPWVANLKNYVVPEAAKRAEALGHKITWTEAYAGALYNFENTLEGIGDGLGDIGWVGSLWEPSKQPLMNVTFALPFVTGDVKAAAEIESEMLANIPAIQEEWTKHGAVYLGPQSIDDYVIISTKEINSVDDIKGMKLYGPGATARWIEGTGAIAIGGGLPVYYNGIKTGVANGAIVPFSSILPFKLHEVAPHITFPGFGGGITGALAMNKGTFDSLPPEMQKLFQEIGKEYGEKTTEGVIHNFNTHKAKLTEAGAKINELSTDAMKKWANTIPNLAKQWADANGAVAKEVLAAYMDGVRKRGITPIRDWDKELD